MRMKNIRYYVFPPKFSTKEWCYGNMYITDWFLPRITIFKVQTIDPNSKLFTWSLSEGVYIVT